MHTMPGSSTHLRVIPADFIAQDPSTKGILDAQGSRLMALQGLYGASIALFRFVLYCFRIFFQHTEHVL
jgi:hypothetical protein